jgi:hypothetical protein
MFPHGLLLMRLQVQIGTRTAGAQQNKSFRPVLREITDGVDAIEIAVAKQTRRARQTTSLMADRGQLNSGSVSGVPDVLVSSDREFTDSSVR